MTLLTDKEIRVAKKPDYFFHGEEDRTVARAQLIKVIGEIEALRKQTEDEDAFVWAFSLYAQVVRWLEAAKKEIG